MNTASQKRHLAGVERTQLQFDGLMHAHRLVNLFLVFVNSIAEENKSLSIVHTAMHKPT